MFPRILAIAAWGHVILLIEEAVEVAQGIETDLLGDLDDGLVGIDHTEGGVFDADIVDELAGGHIQVLSERTAEVLGRAVGQNADGIDGPGIILGQVHLRDQIFEPCGVGTDLAEDMRIDVLGDDIGHH